MGGSVRIVTDHADYFSQIREVVAGSGLREKAYVPAGDGEMAGTNFERKYRKAGRPFYALTAVKIG
jgi:tRNA G46 methylase TrmB